jgi:ribosome-associated heat shock protein Hsp15
MARGPKATGDLSEGPASVRIDKWLWYARFLKTRSLAAAFVSAGRARVNGGRIVKPGHVLRPGDVLTLPFGPTVRIVRIESCGIRRGPAAEARLLYCDLTPGQDTASDLGTSDETPGLSGPARLE